MHDEYIVLKKRGAYTLKEEQINWIGYLIVNSHDNPKLLGWKIGWGTNKSQATRFSKAEAVELALCYEAAIERV